MRALPIRRRRLLDAGAMEILAWARIVKRIHIGQFFAFSREIWRACEGKHEFSSQREKNGFLLLFSLLNHPPHDEQQR